MKQNYLKLIRRLTIFLIFSGTMNVGLFAFFIYWRIKECPPTPYCEHLPVHLSQETAPLAANRLLINTIGQYKTYSFEQLVKELSHIDSIANGFTYRDLALAFLVTFYDFDVQKALQSKELPLKQKILISNSNLDAPLELLIFPGLLNSDYEAILQFARTEEWPFTPFGLFQRLQKEKSRTSTLEEAFYHTPQFMAVELLFGRIDKPIKRKELLQIILEGDWEMLSSFYTEQRVLLDLSKIRRQRFLLLYVDNGSKLAAYMMLKAEGKKALMELDDQRIIKILRLMNERTPAVVDLAVTLAKSSKNQEVVQASKTCLNNFGVQTNVVRQIPAVMTPPIPYVVKEGDSLWKIAKG